MINYSVGDLALNNTGNATTIGDLALTETPVDPTVSLKINPDIVNNITDTLNSINPIPGIENMNLMPDVSGLVASVKASVGNFLSPLIAKTTPIINTLAPYTVPISAGIGAGLVSGYYIGKKHGKLKGILGGLGIGGATGIAVGTATLTIPTFVGIGAAGVGGLVWVLKEMAKQSSVPAPAPATATP